MADELTPEMLQEAQPDLLTLEVIDGLDGLGRENVAAADVHVTDELNVLSALQLISKLLADLAVAHCEGRVGVSKEERSVKQMEIIYI